MSRENRLVSRCFFGFCCCYSSIKHSVYLNYSYSFALEIQRQLSNAVRVRSSDFLPLNFIRYLSVFEALKKHYQVIKVRWDRGDRNGYIAICLKLIHNHDKTTSLGVFDSTSLIALFKICDLTKKFTRGSNNKVMPLNWVTDSMWISH